ncbi:unnamed protein product, partial [Amoebophrya sp. A120]
HRKSKGPADRKNQRNPHRIRRRNGLPLVSPISSSQSELLQVLGDVGGTADRQRFLLPDLQEDAYGAASRSKKMPAADYKS